MVTPAERARFFQRQDVGRLLHYAEQIGDARCIATDRAQFLHREKSALRTWPNGLERGENGLCDSLRLIAARLHHPERNPFRRARSDPWHSAQLPDQLPDRDRVLSLLHSPRFLFERRIDQMQRERFQATDVELQGRIVVFVRPARFLELRIRLGPAFLAVEHHAVPEKIAPRDIVR